MTEHTLEINSTPTSHEALNICMTNTSNDTDVMNHQSQYQEDTNITSTGLSNNSNILSQSVITTKKENNLFGNILDNIKPPNTIQIFLKNINGIKSYNTWTTWKTACFNLSHLQVNIFGNTKTNLNLNTSNRMEARNIIQHKDNYYSAQISTSSNSEPTLTNYQPGGTATISTNQWTGRIKTKIHDTSGMGQ
jgi:hypothetical protein